MAILSIVRSGTCGLTGSRSRGLRRQRSGGCGLGVLGSTSTETMTRYVQDLRSSVAGWLSTHRGPSPAQLSVRCLRTICCGSG